MREILFRGKRMDNGEWVEGGYFFHYGECRIVAEGTVSDYIIHYPVDPATVGQFTGLLANGKRIFEGDVCRFREWSRGEMCWIGNIHYENQQFVISGGPNKECETPFCLQLSRFVAGDIEVIGTIHDKEKQNEGK